MSQRNLGLIQSRQASSTSMSMRESFMNNGNTRRSSGGSSKTTVLNPKTGAVMTQEEIIDDRTKKGLCISCGEVKTHKKKFGGLTMVALDIPGSVSKGTCLKCFGTEPANVRQSMVRSVGGSKRASMMIANRSGQSERKMSITPDGKLALNDAPSSRRLYKRGSSLDDQSTASKLSLDGIDEEPNFKSSFRSELSKMDSFDEFEQPPVRSEKEARENFEKFVKVKTFQNLVEFVRINIDDVSSVALCFKEIANLAANDYEQRRISELSSIVNITVRAVDFSNSSAGLAEEACHMIWVLTDTGDESRKRQLVASGSGTLLTNLMKAHPDNANLHQKACSTLLSLAEVKSNSLVLWNRNILKCLSTSLENEKLPWEVVLKALNAISAALEHPEKFSEDDASIVVNGTVRAMENTSEYDVLAYSFEVLNLVTKTFPEIDELTDPYFILDFMRYNTSKIPIQRKGIEILTYLASKNKKLIVPTGLDRHLYTVLESKIQNTKDSKGSLSLKGEILSLYEKLISSGILSSDDVKDSDLIDKTYTVMYKNLAESKKLLIKGLTLLTSCPASVFDISDTIKFYEFLALVMDINESDSTVQLEAMKLIRILTNDEESARQLPIANNVFVIKNIMECNLSDEKIVKHSFLTFESMSLFSSCRVHLEENHLFDIVANTMAFFNTSKEIHEIGSKILLNLSIHPTTNEVKAISVDAMQIVLKGMQQYPTNSLIQTNGCNFFKIALYQEENIPKMQELGGDFTELLLAAAGAFPNNCEGSAFAVMQIVFG